MLKEIHLLLTYTCTFECDHCFWYCSPDAKGTFTLNKLRIAFREFSKIGTLERIYFEGGEPFLFYPLMIEGISMARNMGLETGIITNAYWATSIEDAALWLKPIRELEVSDLSISDDPFHQEGNEDSPAKLAQSAATELGIPSFTICIEKPNIDADCRKNNDEGDPAMGGHVLFRGRAVEKLGEGLSKRRWDELTRCPYEDLNNPARVHLDPYGNVHLCQGLSMGNMWQTPLSVLVEQYNGQSHPICGPLVRGGPALLAKEFGVDHGADYIDECHLCYIVRCTLIDRYPLYLTPLQVYGIT